MRGEKQALLHQRSTSAFGGARRTKSHRVLILIGYPPTSAFAICEFVATSMSIRGWVSGTNPIIDGVPAKASHQQRNLRCGVASRLVSETVHTVSLRRRPKMRIDIQVDAEVILLFLMLLAGM
jgi:hypothetical protein